MRQLLGHSSVTYDPFGNGPELIFSNLQNSVSFQPTPEKRRFRSGRGAFTPLYNFLFCLCVFIRLGTAYALQFLFKITVQDACRVQSEAFIFTYLFWPHGS